MVVPVKDGSAESKDSNLEVWLWLLQGLASWIVPIGDKKSRGYERK